MKKFLSQVFKGKTKELTREQILRSARVRLSALDQAVFIDSNGKKYPLRNLSETGLALQSMGTFFPDEVSGSIQVGSEKVDVKLLVVRRGNEEIGATFANEASQLRGMLRRAFGDEIHAQGMSEVDPEHQKAVTEGKPRWFYAPGNYELFYVELEGKVVRFELEWNGNFLVYAEGSLRFGLIDRRHDKEHDKVKHAQSSLVKWADQVKEEDKVKATRILENIKSLSNESRSQMQRILQ